MMGNARGFTLIEVLIVLTLLGIMMVLLFASLKICADSWHKGENKINQVNEMALVYNFFQQHVAQAKPLNNIDDASNLQTNSLAFQGKAQSLQFVSGFPASVGRSGLQLFSIAMHKEDDEHMIMVTITPFFVTKDSQQQAEPVVLLRHVKNFSFAYFGSENSLDSSTENLSWHDEWIDKTVQPQLLKVRIELDNGLFCPEMIIPLRVTAQAIPQEQVGIAAPPIRTHE